MRTFIGSVWALLTLAAVGAHLSAEDGLIPSPPGEKTEEDPRDKAKAYRFLFEKVGLSGLPGLTKEKDTGLALQASWELHKKLVKRPKKRPSDLGDGYDSIEMKKFLEFLKDRTKAPVPEWWEVAVKDIAVQKGQDHFYFGIDPDRKELEKINVGKSILRVKKGVEMTLTDEMYAYKSDNVTLKIPKPKIIGDNTLRGDCIIDVSQKGITCLAAYSSTFARSFQITGFESKSGKRLWDAKVWGLASPIHSGPSAGHRVELTTKGETVYVFGEEVSGLYLEAFDLISGKCQFRFCTSYWGNYSETWNLTPRD